MKLIKDRMHALERLHIQRQAIANAHADLKEKVYWQGQGWISAMYECGFISSIEVSQMLDEMAGAAGKLTNGV